MCLPMYSQFPESTFGWRRKSLNFTGMSKEEIKAAATSDDVPLTFEDFEMNGKHCKSGLAFQNGTYLNGTEAVCTDAVKIMQDGKVLTGAENYKCDPTDNEKPCEIYYTQDKFFTVPCKCALDGQNGYCASILGTPEYAASLIDMKRMLEKSECHSLDRHNLAAQLDCNTEQISLEPAISKNFKMKYWPYMHNDAVTECMNVISKDSWSKISQIGAIYIKV